jgi:HK97 family phage prohead protease
MTTLKRSVAAPEGRLFPALELREVETNAGYTMLRGLAVPYGEYASIGWFLESFRAGSLSKSIAEAARALPLNLFHNNQTFPIGAADEWIEEARGLKLDEAETAQEAARHAAAGRLTGLSIEFSPVRSEWTEAEVWNPSAGPEFMDKVDRIEARLSAVGLVQAPAYVKAGVELVRSADAGRRTSEPVRNEAGTPILDELKRATEALRNG